MTDYEEDEEEEEVGEEEENLRETKKQTSDWDEAGEDELVDDEQQNEDMGRSGGEGYNNLGKEWGGVEKKLREG